MKRVFISKENIIHAKFKLLSIMGATGSGKSSVALELASTLQNPLLVSVDAVAAYKYLDIGSAKPSVKEQERFEWIGLNLYEPTEQISTTSFVDLLLPKIEEAYHNNRPVICVGWSHFYEQALLVGRGAGEASDPQYQKSLEAYSNEELYQKLLQIDSRIKTKFHANDRYRSTRYLDLLERQNLSLDDLSKPAEPRPWPQITCLSMGLDIDPETRDRELKKRIEQMLENGWIQEIQNLFEKGFKADCPGLNTIGYLELVDHLKGKMDLKASKERIFFSHRQLAKSQRTWIKGLLKKNTNN